MTQHEFDQRMMKRALREAKKARQRGDYFFGAVVTKGRKILASCGNRVVTKDDSTRHVELEAIQAAVGSQRGRRLDGATLYTTCEPCLLCSGAVHWANIIRVVYGTTQRELGEYGKEHGTAEHLYRQSPVGLVQLWREGRIGAAIEQIMVKECTKQLYETK